MATESRKSKNVRLHHGTLKRAQVMQDRTGIAEKTILSLAVEAGIPLVEKATAKLGAGTTDGGTK